MSAARLVVTGMVQGVGYRAWAVREARMLGVRGWVRNRRDGSVELLLIGADDALETMIAACRDGPHLAEVDTLARAEAEDDGSMAFTQAPTV